MMPRSGHVAWESYSNDPKSALMVVISFVSYLEVMVMMMSNQLCDWIYRGLLL